MYDLGDIWTSGLTVRDATGALADATAVTCTITLPDATTAAATITHPSTGLYTATYPTTQAGRHPYLWQATGLNAGVQADQFDVRSSVSTALLSLADAKAALNMSATITTNDEELRDKIDVVTDLIEGYVGPVIPRTVTRTVTFSGRTFFLPGPVISLTSITPVLTSGRTYTASDFLAETFGAVTRLDGAMLCWGTYQVVYTVGRQGALPPGILEAARLLLARLWRSQRGAGFRPGTGSDNEQTVDVATLITPDIAVCLRPYRIRSVA